MEILYYRKDMLMIRGRFVNDMLKVYMLNDNAEQRTPGVFIFTFFIDNSTDNNFMGESGFLF